MTELSELMDRATRGIAVPTEAIVARVAERGHRLRRRRQVVVGTGAVAAVAVLGVGGVVVGQSLGSSPIAVSPADDGPSSPPSVSPTLPPHAELAPASVVVDRLRAALPAGVTVTGLSASPDPMRLTPDSAATYPGYLIHFAIDGARVGLVVDWPSAERVAMGASVLPPDAECRGTHPMPATCHALPDGSWVETFDERPEGGGAPASEVENYVGYWRTDGWRIYASALNSTQEKGDGTVVSQHPPLTVEQLQAIATSDIWFD